MAKYVIDGETLTGMADALRKVTGETRTYTPGEMIEAVTTILDDVVYILEDDNGNEVVAVMSENEVVFDATANDVRAGKVAAGATGIILGEKEIPAYVTEEGSVKISAGAVLKIDMFSDMCEFTKLQALVCAFNSTKADSVATEKVSINGKVYAVNSTTVLSEVSVDTDARAIQFGLTNTSGKAVVIRYFTYKEVY